MASRCLSTLSGYLLHRYYTARRIRALAARGALRATPVSVNRALKSNLPARRRPFFLSATRREIKLSRKSPASSRRRKILVIARRESIPRRGFTCGGPCRKLCLSNRIRAMSLLIGLSGFSSVICGILKCHWPFSIGICRACILHVRHSHVHRRV